MDDHGEGHGAAHGQGHGHGHGPEVWETSVWPIVAALGAIVSGLGLVWVAKDPDNGFAGPIAGAALAATIIAIGLWWWERRRKSEEQAAGLDADAPDPRYTQVVTFSIAEGQLERAREAGGVISAVQASDPSQLEGFRDFRITVSPSETGPSQVLVETTWDDRDSLGGYNASRENVLGIVSGHDEEVLPGTVQTFDMQVVRDTKKQSYRFGLPAALAMFGGLIAGGFMFGAAQSLFVEETVVADGDEGPVENPYEIIARDNSFNKTSLAAPPEVDVTFTISNTGVNPHNLAFYESDGGAEIAVGDTLDGGATGEVSFTTPGVGTYFFQCDVHPDQMQGTFEVSETAPPPGGGPAGGGPGGPVTVVATDNEFDTDVIEAVAGEEFTVTLENEGDAQHALEFLTEEGGEELATGASTDLISGGESATLTFTPEEAGTFYFHCTVHPTEMFGEFIVAEGSGP